MLFSVVFASHHPCSCRASLPLPKFSAPCFSPLDFSSLWLTLNLQLSTFNRIFFCPSSPHLCALCVLCGENSLLFRSSLIPRHSPLTTKSFTIRTSETPLPQLLYNPHLQAPLGSAGNKGLISLLESALTKRWGVGVQGIPVCILHSGEMSWTSATGDAATDVLRRSPFLATHPRPPGALCRSLGCVPIFPRHSPLATLSFHTCLLQSLCRACDGHTARVR